MSVTAARGFSATGLHCGIKAQGVFDLSLVSADLPGPAAAVFTTSTTAAPTIEIGRDKLSDGTLHTIVIASGCANAGTGTRGRAAIERVAKRAATLIEVSVADVLVSTTGPIGPLLPDDLVRTGLTRAVPARGTDPASATAAATAILTTDSVVKQAVIEREGYVIGGMSKGAGMVRPDMATMLAYITTDAIIEAGALRASLPAAVDVTFNCLNFDGCQSTNDTVVVMASGASGVEADVEAFTRHLTDLCRELAWQMADDAEGASKVVTIEISGAANDRVARQIGKAIADSALVRSSFYGGEPDWGRLLAAAGATGHQVSVEDISVAYAGVRVAQGGVAESHSDVSLVDRLAEGNFTVEMSVGTGRGSAKIVTTDLTPEYVRFNAGRS